MKSWLRNFIILSIVVTVTIITSPFALVIGIVIGAKNVYHIYKEEYKEEFGNWAEGDYR